MRSPSATNIPCRRRPFLSRSARTSLTRGLEKAVICLIPRHPGGSRDPATTSLGGSPRGPGFRRDDGWAVPSILPETVLDERNERVQRFLRAVSLGVDDNRVAHRRAEHHQPHDRSAADPAAVLLDLDRGGKAGSEGDEAGAGAGVQTPPVLHLDRPARHAQTVSPSISEATEMYLRP